jgi:exodeoxyribonuclease VII large subunit
MANTFLDVPFKEKDEAKALGARWDGAAKKWYVPEGKDLAAFAAWLPAGSKTSAPVVKPISNDLVPDGFGESTELASTKQGISLSQLLAGVAQAVAQAFRSGVWTVVEVVEARTKNGHVYLELSERNAEGNLLATARATIWANTASKILPEFERATGASIAPGIKLLVRAKPVFKAQYGFGIEIDAIDPEYTLGDLEARKREIRTRLKQDGVIDANKRLPAPWDFNVVLVIAPQGAAGLGDFQAEAQRLEHFGICRFIYAHSRFQGEGAPQEIRQVLLTAMNNWSGTPPDAVAIIRGGGAVNDLAWLNDYELAKIVCTLQVPVLTGIGHERDSTILDEVAHTRFDTPSKVIGGIEQVIRKRVSEAKSNFEQLAGLANRAVNAVRAKADQRFSAIQTGATRQVASARRQTTELMNELRLSAMNTLHDARQTSGHLMTEVRHEAHQGLNMVQRQVPALMAEIRTEAANVLNTARTVSATRLEGIRDRTKLDLVRSREGVQLELRDVTNYARRALSDAKTSSTALFREIAGQGPEKTLGRGFAIVRNAAGKPVTSKSNVKTGETLDIEFRDGHVATQAT